MTIDMNELITTLIAIVAPVDRGAVIGSVENRRY